MVKGAAERAAEREAARVVVARGMGAVQVEGVRGVEAARVAATEAAAVEAVETAGARVAVAPVAVPTVVVARLGGGMAAGAEVREVAARAVSKVAAGCGVAG